MLIDHVVKRNTQVVGNAESLDFTMDEESMGLIMQGFSDSLYSDKIGSIVREITSNCFDSHIEAGIETNVDIIIKENIGNEQSTISFIDYGVGISPQRMKDIYSKYGASTKRSTNKEIGGWGFGAKVPFAYSHMFEVITHYNGIKYHYILHRGESIPQIELLNEEPTEEDNGSEIRIPLKQSSDADLFRKAIKYQLPFFDNVNYHNCGINNGYQIIRGKHFIVNPNATHINSSGICLGKVYYPIDFNKLGYEYSSYDFNTGICLRFNVGELSVTWSRESIEWIDENIEKVKEKIELAKQEIIELQKKSKGKPITDFVEYIKQYKGEPILTLAGHTIVAEGFADHISQDYYYLPHNNYYDDHPEFMFSDYGIWIIEYNGDKKRKDMFRAESVREYSGNGRIRFLDIYKDSNWLIFLAQEDTRILKRTNVWLREQYPDKRIAIMKPAECKKTLFYGGMGSHDEREELKSWVPRYLDRKLSKYENQIPPKEWIKEYNKNKRNQKSIASVANKTQEEIHIGVIKHYGKVQSQNIRLEEIQQKLKQGYKIIYGGRDDVDTMREFLKLFDNTNHFRVGSGGYHYSDFDGYLGCWRVNASVRKLLATFDGAYTIEEFINAHRRIWKQLYLCDVAKDIRFKYRLLIDDVIDYLNPEYPLFNLTGQLKRIHSFGFKDNYNIIWNHVESKFLEQFAIENWFLKDVDLRNIQNLLESYSQNLPFLGYLRGNSWGNNNSQEMADIMANLVRQYHKTKHVFPLYRYNRKEQTENEQNN